MARDLWGEAVKPKREPREPRWYTSCFICGRRVLAEHSVPVAFHTDYCKRCCQTAKTKASGGDGA